VEHGETVGADAVVLEVVREGAKPGVGLLSLQHVERVDDEIRTLWGALTSLPALSSGASPETYRIVGSPLSAGVFSMLSETAEAVRFNDSHSVPRVAMSS